MPTRANLPAPSQPSTPSPALGLSHAAGSPAVDPWRERLRRWVMAAAVGAAVIVTPGGPSPGRGPGWQPPAYVRALRWRDIIRLRLSPWLLSGMFGPPPATPSSDASFDIPPPPGIPPDPRRESLDGPGAPSAT